MTIIAGFSASRQGSAPLNLAAQLSRTTGERVFENRQVRASRLVMVVIMARWTMASWWSGLVS